METGARVANDQVLMLLMSMCVLHERLHLEAPDVGAALAQLGVDLEHVPGHHHPPELAEDMRH